MMRFITTLLYIVAILLFTFSCRPEGEVVREDKDNFTISDQNKIGNELSKFILENPIEYPMYRPEAYRSLYNYLNDRVSTVINTRTVLNRSKFNWKVYILRDDKRKTAFTMPGGKIYITSAYCRLISSDAQLLALISHEMYYADNGIAMSLLERDFSGLILGDIIFNNPVSEMGEMIATLREMPFTDDQVEDADQYAIDNLCPFNYAADGIATILSSITDENFPLEWEETRPSYDDRSNFIRKYAQHCGEESAAAENLYKDQFLIHLD